VDIQAVGNRGWLDTPKDIESGRSRHEWKKRYWNRRREFSKRGLKKLLVKKQY
jgi:hypothetical protein